jgi:peroxiredoxin
MKKISLMTLFLLFCVFSYAQEKLYKEFGKTQMLTEEEYKMHQLVFQKKLQQAKGKLRLTETIIDSTMNGTSVVYTYKLEQDYGGVKIARSREGEWVYSIYGQKFPDFQLKNLEGKTVRLSDFKGKPILMNFWFTGCRPCIKEMPRLNEIKAMYGDQVVFLSISFHSAEEVTKFLEKHPFEFQHLVGAKKLIEQIGLSAYPKNILISREGKVYQILDAIHPKLDEEGNVVPGDGRELIREIEIII